MRRHRDVIDILTGAAMLVLLAGVFVLSYSGKLTEAHTGYEISAIFKNIDGLSVGALVSVAGIQVGAVRATDFQAATNQAVVVMDIESGIHIPTDSAALIVSDGMLGAKFIKIEPGGEEQFLGDGGHIEYVQNSVIIEDVLQKLVTEVEASRAAKKDGDANAPAPAENGTR